MFMSHSTNVFGKLSDTNKNKDRIILSLTEYSPPEEITAEGLLEIFQVNYQSIRSVEVDGPKQQAGNRYKLRLLQKKLHGWRFKSSEE